jgi:hypothetical protein
MQYCKNVLYTYGVVHATAVFEQPHHVYGARRRVLCSTVMVSGSAIDETDAQVTCLRCIVEMV